MTIYCLMVVARIDLASFEVAGIPHLQRQEPRLGNKIVFIPESDNNNSVIFKLILCDFVSKISRIISASTGDSIRFEQRRLCRTWYQVFF